MKRCKHCRVSVRWIRLRRVGKAEPTPTLVHNWSLGEYCGLGRDTKAEEE